MTHFVGLVVANSEEEVEELLISYSEHAEVEAYFKPVDLDRMVAYANENNIAFTNPIELVEYWVNEPGVLSESGDVGYMSKYNPEGQWDWYEIGGGWANIIPGDYCLAEAVQTYFAQAKKDYLPAVIVDSDGWHAAQDFGWFGTSSNVPGNENIVLEKLQEHKGKLVYIVDFHC